MNMEFTQVIEMPPAEFYNVLIRSVLHDIQFSGRKPVPLSELKGYRYKKKIGSGAAAEILITKQEANRLYGFQTSAADKIYQTTYRLEPADEENHCRVTYTEEWTSEGRLQQWNDRIMGRLLMKSKKQRIQALLKAIETDYQKNNLQP